MIVILLKMKLYYTKELMADNRIADLQGVLLKFQELS